MNITPILVTAISIISLLMGFIIGIIPNISETELKDAEHQAKCENLFYSPYNDDPQVIFLCEDSVWKTSFPNAYNQY